MQTFSVFIFNVITESARYHCWHIYKLISIKFIHFFFLAWWANIEMMLSIFVIVKVIFKSPLLQNLDTSIPQKLTLANHLVTKYIMSILKLCWQSVSMASSFLKFWTQNRRYQIILGLPKSIFLQNAKYFKVSRHHPLPQRGYKLPEAFKSIL